MFKKTFLTIALVLCLVSLGWCAGKGTNFHETDTNAALNAIFNVQADCAAVTATSITSPTIGYATDTASDDDYLIAPSPAFTAYTLGMRIIFRAVTANTTGATVNVNGLGAKALVLPVSTALTTNFIKAGSIVEAVYDGTSFQLLQPAAQ